MSKQDRIDNILGWIRMLLGEPDAELSDAMRQLSASDLKIIHKALDTAGTQWMNNMVHEVMKMDVK